MQSSISHDVLEDTPARAFRFLSGLGTNQMAYAVLVKNGMQSADVQQGWDLLHEVAGYRTDKPAVVSSEATRALATLDAWDEPTFRKARAALKHAFPTQYAFVFDGLEAKQGREAILSVSLFLVRLSQLESGKDRPKADHKQNHAALERLAERGITKDELHREHDGTAPPPRAARLSPNRA